MPYVKFTATGTARTKKISQFEKRFIPEPNSGCWIWTEYCNHQGYGRWRYDGKRIGAHRISWMLYCGPISGGLSVLHHCDNPSCVNPDHLFLGTHDDNMRDMTAKGRSSRHGALPGEAHPHAKLTAEQALNIRADHRFLREVAEDYNISPTQVASIRHRIKWRHLPERISDGGTP
jgi:hypothetical protein